MACYDLEILSSYQDGSLTDAENQQITQHLTGCASCQEKMRSLGQAGLFFQIALGSRRYADCLGEEELGAYLSGRMSDKDRSRMEAHLLLCPKCLHEVAVLSDPGMLGVSAGLPLPDALARKRLLDLAPRPIAAQPTLHTISLWGLRAVAAGLLAVLALGSWWTSQTPPASSGGSEKPLLETHLAGLVPGAFLADASIGSERTALQPDRTDLARFAHDVGLIFREMQRVADNPRPGSFEMVQEDILSSGIVESIARLKELIRDARDRQFLTDCEYMLMRAVKVEPATMDREVADLVTEITRLNLIETARLLDMEGSRSLWLASL